MSNFVPQLADETPNATEYIAHHLTFLTNHTPQGLLDLSVVNLDSVVISVLLAVLFGGSFIIAARKATSGTPGKWQNFVELVVSFVDSQVRGIFQGHNRLIAPCSSPRPVTIRSAFLTTRSITRSCRLRFPLR